jgi:hypothetical protein
MSQDINQNVLRNMLQISKYVDLNSALRQPRILPQSVGLVALTGFLQEPQVGNIKIYQFW